MKTWKKFHEMSLRVKEYCYGHLNIEYIGNADYTHAKRVYKYFKRNNLGEYHDLYVPSDILLLADVCEKNRNIFLEIYDLIPLVFLLHQD